MESAAAAATTSTDVIIIGSGLAGLVVALHLLDAAAAASWKVTILEKESKAGLGNSIKASSGINSSESDEHVPQFRHDTVQSAGDAARPHLIEPLVAGSAEAVQWLRDRLQVDLSASSQLGGHSAQRTHRPGGPRPVGAEIMGKLRPAVESHHAAAAADRVAIITNAKVTALRSDGQGRVTGVEYEDTATKECQSITARQAVVIATGGFAADRTLLARYCPEFASFPATQGSFSTGDGIQLARELQAAVVDMDKIQVHPTGFVDPQDPDNPHKFLAAEVLRGVGGLLLNEQGKR